MFLFEDYFSSFVSSEKVHLFGNLQAGREGEVGSDREDAAAGKENTLQVSVRPCSAGNGATRTAYDIMNGHAAL